MKNAVLVGMVVFLAAILSPLSCLAQSVRMSNDCGHRVISGPGYVVATNGGPSVVMRQTNGHIDTGVGHGSTRGGGYRTSGRGYDNDRPRVSSRDRYDSNDNFGYQDNGRRSGNQNRTGINIGVGAKIGGVRVNVGYNKTTYSKPKPKPTPINKCRLTLVQEIGDGLETISDIVVTNPDKELSPGKRIVFKRNGQPYAEYEVDRVSGETVFVNVINAPRGNPRQGDGFHIKDPPKDINVVD